MVYCMSLVCVFGWGWGEGPEKANITMLNLHESASDYRQDDTKAENLLHPESGGQLPGLLPQPRLLMAERLLAGAQGGSSLPTSASTGQHSLGPRARLLMWLRRSRDRKDRHLGPRHTAP